MKLQDIEAFVAVADTGSINRAALRLNLTQPATTRRVQNFEAGMGAELLDRSAKPPVLTPIGRQVLEHCRRVLKAVEGLKASTCAAGEPTGDLRIGVAHGLGEVVLGSPLEDVRRRFQRIRLHVLSNWTSRLIDDTRNGGLDCAIGMLTKDHAIPPGMDAITLGEENVVVVAARKAYPLRKARGRFHLRDLATQTWILNPPGCGCRAALQRAFDRANSPLRIATEVFGEDLQLSWIARSGGLGLVPRRQFDHNPHRRRLQVVNVADFELQTRITLLHSPSLGSLAPAVHHLQAHIARRLRENK
jgi:DNA-binding transcriptional LysR family regulator